MPIAPDALSPAPDIPPERAPVAAIPRQGPAGSEAARREREIVAIATLAARSDARAQLEDRIGAALDAGVSRREIAEVLVQTALYAGFPAALDGIAAAKAVFARRDGRPPCDVAPPAP